MRARGPENGRKSGRKTGVDKKLFFAIIGADNKSCPLTIMRATCAKGVNMSFVEYKTTRARKAPEQLEAGKTWQVNARRLIVPLDAKKYGLKVKEWQEGAKKRHAITWAKKPYCKLLLNSDKKAKAIARLEVNTSAGLAIQVNPANYNEFYVSIPKGALEAMPKASCMLDMSTQGAIITVSKQ